MNLGNCNLKNVHAVGMAEPRGRAFDEVVCELNATIGQSRSITSRIEVILFRPCTEEQCGEGREKPGTVEEALLCLNSDLQNVNRKLEQYAGILQNHFGELKLE